MLQTRLLWVIKFHQSESASLRWCLRTKSRFLRIRSAKIATRIVRGQALSWNLEGLGCRLLIRVTILWVKIELLVSQRRRIFIMCLCIVDRCLISSMLFKSLAFSMNISSSSWAILSRTIDYSKSRFSSFRMLISLACLLDIRMFVNCESVAPSFSRFKLVQAMGENRVPVLARASILSRILSRVQQVIKLLCFYAARVLVGLIHPSIMLISSCILTQHFWRSRGNLFVLTFSGSFLINSLRHRLLIPQAHEPSQCPFLVQQEIYKRHSTDDC